jgi:DNA-binding XRE family transcriptional regulator
MWGILGPRPCVIKYDNTIARMKRATPHLSPDAFWRYQRGLDLVHAALRPGGRELEVRFRYGQAYRVDVASLGLRSPAILATLGNDPRVVVVGWRDGSMADVPVSAILTVAEPAYRGQVTQKAATVGAKVRALRLASGRTAIEVAQAAGMARSNFARLEASRHEPRLTTLRRVAEALAVPLDALLG